MPEGGKLGFDGRVINDQMGAGLQEALEDKHVTISYEEDLVGEIWENRPALSAEPVWILEEKYAGKSAAQKIEDPAWRDEEAACRCPCADNGG